MTTGRKRKERRLARQKRQAAKANTPISAKSPTQSAAAIAGGLWGTHAAAVTAGALPAHGDVDEMRLADRRIESRAIEQEWPVDLKYRESLVKGQVLIALDGNREPRDRTRAFSALLKANEQNMRARGQGGDGSVVGVQVNVGAQVGQSIQAAVTAEPEYLDWLRERELAEAGDADAVGANGHNGHAGAVPDAAAHSSTGQGSNGHHPGNGRH